MVVRITPTSGPNRRKTAPSTVRVIDYTLDDGRDNPEQYRLLTTILDPGKADARDLALAYAQRWEIEHTFRLMKSQMGWAAARVRHPEQAERWTWLLVAAYTQLRPARTLSADLRRPRERRTRPGKPPTPYRARRAFRHLRRQLGTPARLPKTTHPGPGRPPGSTGTPAPRHRIGSEIRKTDPAGTGGRKKKG
ncbi:transposase [Nocardia sp. NPDC101769]|uniref:transposase n=1 Tax=Nocardia sp. NPDC101769 TaxID=3364333 RepID=UPI003816FD6C